MQRLWDAIQRGYLRVIEPVVGLLVRRRVNPNHLTAFGTLCTVVSGIIYATGHIKTAGWFFGLTALFDVLDGSVARRTGQSTTFGAFFDSSLDRVADGAVLGGIAFFYATSAVAAARVTPQGPGLLTMIGPVEKHLGMLAICLLGIIGTFLVSYTRARAESLGIDAKVGIMQRPERVVLLSAPQAFFGLALHGWVLMGIVTLLTLTAWLTAGQRMAFVRRATRPADDERLRQSAAAARALSSITEMRPPVESSAPRVEAPRLEASRGLPASTPAALPRS